METPVPLKPYQERVIEERNQLRERLGKLKTYLEVTPFPVGAYEGAAREERVLLHYQRAAMDEYLHLLQKRIDLWGGDNPPPG